MSDEIEKGKQVIEKVMGEFEERTFETKEKMEFGAKYSEEIRKLGILWEMNTILKCE